MGKDILVILMIAFGFFAIVMFIMFFVYLRKYYNSRRLDDDYKNVLDNSDVEDDSFDEITNEPETSVIEEEKEEIKEDISFEKINSSIQDVSEPKEDIPNEEIEDEMEFIPIKKK